MIDPNKLRAGHRLFRRFKQKMGSTRMTTLNETMVEIVNITRTEGSMLMATVRLNGRTETWPTHRLKRLFTWSMYDSNLAEVERLRPGMPISHVRLKPGVRAPRLEDL